MSTPFTDRLELKIPLIQAPMAGVSTERLASEVSNAGALGSISVGNLPVAAARSSLAAIRALTSAPYNVNLFCHRPAAVDPAAEAAWCDALRPSFAAYGALPPADLRESYRSFVEDPEMLSLLLDETPPVTSFHFGLPSPEAIAALRARGSLLLASVTSVAEAVAAERAGIDVLVAQGYEAGGHRGTFDPHAPDERLGTLVLTRLLTRTVSIPVVAAGGIMDGAGIASALTLGACAAQLGTAFIGCPESSASAAHRAAITAPGVRTVMTSVISGRAARCVMNKFTALGAELKQQRLPAYPRTYTAGKALDRAAAAAGEHGFGAQWAGQGVALSRTLPAAEIVGLLGMELEAAQRGTVRG